jgi:hypothetical protein
LVFFLFLVVVVGQVDCVLLGIILEFFLFHLLLILTDKGQYLLLDLAKVSVNASDPVAQA